jgi:hypothetical protein
MVQLTSEDLDIIARLTDSEVGRFRANGYPDWEFAAGAIADTILNRTVARERSVKVPGDAGWL